MANEMQEYGISYVGLGASHAMRAMKHEARAQYWMEQGNPEYAAGSRKKAQRARAAYREYDMWRHGAHPQQVNRSLVNRMIEAAQANMVRQFEAALLGH